MRWTDEKVEGIIGVLLRTGVLSAAFVVLVGALCYMAHYGGATPEYHVFRGEPTQLRSVTGVAGSAFGGSCRGVIQLGLLMLIATPIARVLFSVFAFGLQRDWTYVVVTLIVFSVLVYSLSGLGY